ncbi:MgtC/SapB family protein [Magnetospirillum sulfuroxidans]|uniref:MgtC/SapB family protein n=1 Tax=Magnetospirillum sulfuroxidans TaxID=611300 RepID=A0ABS5IBL8_9PROT|nr:MgtC/SapB family protein [Magnetospirillum sulfuroxidans]MBR9971671.1 MgtC/SapB family protein [Magnetospirillum sulfuroxidans]
MEHVELYQRLALSLSIGLLMGVERGWDKREDPDGHRAAGIRTFSLIGLFGGVVGWFTQTVGPLALLGGFVAVAAMVVSGYVMRARARPEVGFTTEIAELTAFALAALAAMGEGQAAAAGGVVATAFLGAKDVLHDWVRRLDRLEMRAVIKLLLISVVMLPVLPNQGYGPGEVLNPYKLWLLVVMVAFISFLGYFAIKIAGPRIGSLLTGVFGGLASSTALTVSFARMGKVSPLMQPVLAAGVTVANATMYVRLWVIVFVLNQPIGLRLALPLGAMALTGFIGSWVLWRAREDETKPGATALSNPFELGMAIKFAILLAVVMLASQALQRWAGATGLYLLSALAGLADVDAIALSMVQMGGREVALTVATTGITIAAFVNTGVKVALVGGLCGGMMVRRVGWVMLAVLVGGGLGLLIGRFSF